MVLPDISHFFFLEPTISCGFGKSCSAHLAATWEVLRFSMASPDSPVACFYFPRSYSFNCRWHYFSSPACKDKTILLGWGNGRVILIRLSLELWHGASTWEALNMHPFAMGSVQTTCRYRHLVLKTVKQYQGVPMGITRSAWCQTLHEVNGCCGFYFYMCRGLNMSCIWVGLVLNSF